MSNSKKTWEASVLTAIRGVAGAKATDDLEAQWIKHNALKAPVVTLFGSYDSGKSTLLKRLLVDSGVTVPDWLTIAARRDTFEVNEVEAIGCLFRDTPGIASGNSEHELAAREALTTTDVILVVLPPQLITGDQEKILAVVGGELFRAGGLELGEALAFTMCKMDEGGYEPIDDPLAYGKYLKDKQGELLAILDRARVKADPEKIFGVAADAFQAVVNAKNPGRVAYDSSRDWDGIAALHAWLESLSKSLNVLRPLARGRFLYAAAEAHRTVLVQRIKNVELGLQETRSNEERFVLLRQQLEALVKQARTTLDATIDEELSTAASAHLADKTAIAKFVIPRLEKAIERWGHDCGAELDKLIAGADAEVEARSESPGATKVNELFEEGEEQVRSHQSQTGKKVVTSLFEKAQAALRSYHEQSLGMKIDKAREELRKIDEMKTFKDYLKTTKGGKGFSNPMKADTARKIVNYHAIVDTASPFVIELGALLWEEKQRRDLEKNRAKRRQELRDKIRQVASKFGDSAWQNWELRANQLKAWLSQHEIAAHTESESLDEELRMRNESKEDLTRLLAE